jgi:hypothetical protein
VFRQWLVALAAAAIAGCGTAGNMQGENYGNLLNSPASLVVVQEEHPTGWGRPDCFACHNIMNIHTVNRTGLPNCSATITQDCLNLSEIQAIVSSQLESSCVMCHGNNGVNQ